MKIQGVIIGAISLFTVSVAQAQYYWGGGATQGMGPYFRMGLGPSIFQQSELKEFVVQGLGFPSARVDYNVGVAFTGAFGFAFNQYVGLDFESGYTWAQMNSAQGYTVNNSNMGNIPFLANVTLSYPIPHSNVVPYIGGGAGGSDSVFDAHNFTFNSPALPFVDGTASDVVFAYQGFAGVRFMLGQGLSVGVAYRYFATGNPTFSGGGASTEFQGVRTHSVLFTFQANF